MDRGPGRPRESVGGEEGRGSRERIQGRELDRETQRETLPQTKKRAMIAPGCAKPAISEGPRRHTCRRSGWRRLKHLEFETWWGTLLCRTRIAAEPSAERLSSDAQMIRRSCKNRICGLYTCMYNHGCKRSFHLMNEMIRCNGFAQLRRGGRGRKHWPVKGSPTRRPLLPNVRSGKFPLKVTYVGTQGTLGAKTWDQRVPGRLGSPSWQNQAA